MTGRRFYYGWIIVAVSGLSLLVAFGIRLSFTVFFVSPTEEFGWLRAETSLIFSFSMVIFAATTLFAGMAVDRWGARLVFAIGAAFMATGLLLSSFIQTLPQLILTYGVIVGLGITILGLGPQAGNLATWFRRRLGLAIGLAFAGTGLGTLILTPAVELIIAGWGWRAAYRVLALLALLLVPVILLFMRRSTRYPAFGAGAALFPWLAGRVFDLNGTYTAAFAIAAVTIIVSTVALWLAQSFSPNHTH